MLLERLIKIINHRCYIQKKIWTNLSYDSHCISELLRINYTGHVVIQIRQIFLYNEARIPRNCTNSNSRYVERRTRGDGRREGDERQNGGSDRDEMDRTLADQYAGGRL